ncbi:MAG: T9SS type A sorting domain-containing protein, partial [Bacteroidota bacterium]
VRCFSGGILLTTEAPAFAAASAISHSAAPNPFDQSMIIKYELPDPTSVHIQIRTIDGRVVKTLKNKSLSAKSKVEWDGSNAAGYELPAGVYLYTITTANASVSGKIVKN